MDQVQFEPERASRVVLALLPGVGGDVVLEQAGVATLDRRRPRFLRAAAEETYLEQMSQGIQNKLKYQIKKEMLMVSV